VERWQPNTQPTGPIWKDGGRVLDPMAERIGDNGTPMQLWDWYATTNQQWKLVYAY
jgi:hypothetical protein